MRLLLPTILSSLALTLAPLAVGCGGSTDDEATTSPGGSGDDAGADGEGGATDDAAVDGGANDAANEPEADDPLDPNYPAAHNPLPQVDYNGGHILLAPKVVTITFEGDPLESRLQQFGDVITTTPWWEAVSKEYCTNAGCIGPGSSGGHVVLPASTTTSYTDSVMPNAASTVKDLIKANVADGTFPAPEADTLYVVYFPAGVSVSLSAPGQGTSQSCVSGGFGGYHQDLAVVPPGATQSVKVAYAIVPRCGNKEATTTVAASHEIVEAATDPATSGSPAWYMTSSPWAVLGGEVADLCVDVTGGNDTYQESGFTVQRSWSNMAAAASHDPCVPTPASDVYFGSAPVADQLQMAIGDTQTVEVDGFSDGPMPADWSVSVVDFAHFQGTQSALTLSIDKSSMHNGSKGTLTVSLVSDPGYQGAWFAIVSSSGNVRHMWPMVVQAQ